MSRAEHRQERPGAAVSGNAGEGQVRVAIVIMAIVEMAAVMGMVMRTMASRVWGE